MAAIPGASWPRRRAALAAGAAGIAAWLGPTHGQGVPRLPRATLPALPLRDALAQRRSLRNYAAEPVSLAQLAMLLRAAQGVTGANGLRTAPSAGALYPLELYLRAARVDGLAPGVYHYVAASHALELIRSGLDANALAVAAGGQGSVADAPLVVAIAAVPARTASRYGARSARYVAFEGGAASQNLALAAVALGLGAVVVGAFDDLAVARALGLPAGTEPLVLMPVGRP